VLLCLTHQSRTLPLQLIPVIKLSRLAACSSRAHAPAPPRPPPTDNRQGGRQQPGLTVPSAMRRSA
jgi:hypothetical protein